MDAKLSREWRDTQNENDVKHIIHEIGDDPNREGLLNTPKRVIKMWKEIYGGYGQDPADIMTIFPSEKTDEMVLVKDIPFYSMCEHHMMPFFGVAHVAYIPNPDVGIVGISKLARLVDIYARRLQIQERLGIQVTEALVKYLKPLGAACILSGTHTCMTMRGIKKPGSMTVTSSLTGVFKNKAETRAELMAMIKL